MKYLIKCSCNFFKSNYSKKHRIVEQLLNNERVRILTGKSRINRSKAFFTYIVFLGEGLRLAIRISILGHACLRSSLCFHDAGSL